VILIRGPPSMPASSGWACSWPWSGWRGVLVSFMAAVPRRSRRTRHERHVPLAQELQLSAVGRWCAGVQRRYLDATRRAGLAGAYRAHPSQRHGRGYGDGVAVRAAAAAVAVDWP